MNSSNETFEVKKVAKSWAQKVLKYRLSSQEQCDLAQWLEQKRAHKKAFFHYRNQLLAKQTSYRRYFTASIAMAASVLLFVIMPTVDYQQPQPKAAQVLTFALGKTHVLSDGSLVELNVNSEVSVQFSKHTREISLVRGDAWFKVAADKSRPFIVKHLSTQVTALGTSFAVNTHQNIRVQVTEHNVEVKNTNSNQVTLVNEGEGVVKEKLGWRKQSVKELNASLAWREQLIIFDGTPLYKALKQLSVYMNKDIELMATIDRNEPVTGRFKTNKPELALDMICDGLGLSHRQLSETKLILF